MKKHLITIILLVLGALFAVVGSTPPATGFLVLAAFTEIVVWIRVIKWPRWDEIK